MIKYTAFYVIVSILFNSERGYYESNVFQDKIENTRSRDKAQKVYDDGMRINDSLGGGYFFNIVFLQNDTVDIEQLKSRYFPHIH